MLRPHHLDPPLLDWSGSVLVAREGDRAGPALYARDADTGFAARQLPLDSGAEALKAAGAYLASHTIVGQIGGTEEGPRSHRRRRARRCPRYSITLEDSFVWDFAVQDEARPASKSSPTSTVARPLAGPAAEPWPHVVARRRTATPSGSDATGSRSHGA